MRGNEVSPFASTHTAVVICAFAHERVSLTTMLSRYSVLQSPPQRRGTAGNGSTPRGAVQLQFPRKSARESCLHTHTPKGIKMRVCGFKQRIFVGTLPAKARSAVRSVIAAPDASCRCGHYVGAREGACKAKTQLNIQCLRGILPRRHNNGVTFHVFSDPMRVAAVIDSSTPRFLGSLTERRGCVRVCAPACFSASLRTEHSNKGSRTGKPCLALFICRRQKTHIQEERRAKRINLL